MILLFKAKKKRLLLQRRQTEYWNDARISLLLGNFLVRSLLIFVSHSLSVCVTIHCFQQMLEGDKFIQRMHPITHGGRIYGCISAEAFFFKYVLQKKISNMSTSKCLKVMATRCCNSWILFISSAVWFPLMNEICSSAWWLLPVWVKLIFTIWWHIWLSIL